MMTRILHSFWRDERGAVLSAEAVLLGSVAVVGVTAGAKMTATAVDAELNEAALAFRRLDQSYSYGGFGNCRAWTAGSCYHQPDVEDSCKEPADVQKEDEPSDPSQP